jgi:transposase
MTSEGLITVALGLGEGWSVDQCSFEGTTPELLLKLDFEAGHRFGCPECGANSPTHDTVVKRWRHLDFFQYRCEHEARVPRVDCEEHGVRLIDFPIYRDEGYLNVHRSMRIKDAFENLIAITCTNPALNRTPLNK